MSEHSAPSSATSEADEASAPVVSFELTYADYKNTMWEYWNSVVGHVSLPLLVVFVIDTVAAATAAWFASWLESFLGTAICAGLCGFFLAGSLQQGATYRRRCRVAKEGFARLASFPLDVQVFHLADGLRLQRAHFVQNIAWEHITALVVRGSPRRWVIFDSTGDISWVPETAFSSAQAFEAFVDEVHACWRNAKPSGKGFEVIVSSGNPH